MAFSRSTMGRTLFIWRHLLQQHGVAVQALVDPLAGGDLRRCRGRTE